MAQKKETKFQIKVIKCLKTLRKTWFTKISQISKRGDPDIIMCVNGSFIAMELKSAKDILPSELQVYTLEKIDAANGIAIVVHPENWDKVFRYLIELSKEEDND